MDTPLDIAQLYERIDASEVQRMIDEKQEENLFLDFKTVTRSDLGDNSDRKNFARALSGFANSSGGIILWGVDARKEQSDGPDCACGAKEIDSVSTFVSRLNEFTGQFVRPFVDGVRHRPISTDGDRGFVVTLVPESDAGPHMALGGEQRYYKRSGSSFYRMEHFDIEDMFGRRRKPKLALAYKVRPHGRSQYGSSVTWKGAIAVSLENQGRGSAKNIFFALHVAPPYSISRDGIDGNGNETLRRLTYSTTDFQEYVAPPGLVFHPGMALKIAELTFSFPNNQPSLPDGLIEAVVAADGVPQHRLSLNLAGEEVIRIVKEGQ